MAKCTLKFGLQSLALNRKFGSQKVQFLSFKMKKKVILLQTKQKVCIAEAKLGKKKNVVKVQTDGLD